MIAKKIDSPNIKSKIINGLKEAVRWWDVRGIGFGSVSTVDIKRIIRLKRKYTFSLRISNLNVITFAIAQDTKKTKINDTETTHRTFKRIGETAT